MRKLLIPAIASLGLLATSGAFANTFPASTIRIDTTPSGSDSGGHSIGPYIGTFGLAGNTSIYCDDLVHNIGVGATVSVNVSDVTDLSLTRFGGAGAATVLPGAVAVADYEKIFYLSTFLSGSYGATGTYYSGKGVSDNSSNTTVNADIQDAMWSVFAPTATPNAGSTAVAYWLGQASSNYSHYDYSTYRILTDDAAKTSSTGQYNGNQELFVNTNPSNSLKATPEPGTIGMLFSGLAAVGFAIRRRGRKVAN